MVKCSIVAITFSDIISFSSRHPVANQRINSSDVLRTLEKSDRILLPSVATDSEENNAKLGDPLSASSELYLDLQKTYLLTS